MALAVLPISLRPGAAQGPEKAPRFPLLRNQDALNLFGTGNQQLPGWALALAGPLPRTTASMLQLDHLHRAKNPLGPVLAGKLHWAAADALGCAYGRTYAEADLRRAGLKDDALGKFTDAERVAVTFARKLTTAAHTVSDAEMDELLRLFGPEKTVAIVHTLAWANFRNRIILALGVAVETGGPLPPVEPRLDAALETNLKAPERPPWKDVQASEVGGEKPVAPVWRKLADAEVEAALERQKTRKPRIPVPATAAPATNVVWTQVSSGYQPLLTKTWFDTMRTFQQEAQLDRVFSNSFFWVITRTNECFY